MQSVGLRVQGFSAFRGLGFGLGVLFFTAAMRLPLREGSTEIGISACRRASTGPRNKANSLFFCSAFSIAFKIMTVFYGTSF